MGQPVVVLVEPGNVSRRALWPPAITSRYTASYFSDHDSLSTNRLSIQRPLPPMPIRTPASSSGRRNASFVNWLPLPWSVVRDQRPAVPAQRLLDGAHAEAHLHRVVEVPGQHEAARPVHHRHQVEPTAHRDVGDVRAPQLAGPDDVQAAQQVRIDSVARLRPRRVRGRVDCSPAHHSHQAPRPVPSHRVASPTQMEQHAARAVVGNLNSAVYLRRPIVVLPSVGTHLGYCPNLPVHFCGFGDDQCAGGRSNAGLRSKNPTG